MIIKAAVSSEEGAEDDAGGEGAEPRFLAMSGQWLDSSTVDRATKAPDGRPGANRHSI